ncbi:MAG: hypothetical protein ACYC4U_20535 [Pirellulaceae bacterium]
MIRHKSVGWMTLVLIGLVGQHVTGQDEGAAELYGRGVHAYFAGDYKGAVGWLAESIEKNGLDPRSYYFRGLALANISGVDAGRADFEQGAEVEINRTDRPKYNINAALQRVQGSLRLELEKVRAATRKAAVERKQKRDRVRYEELKRREDIVLFKPYPTEVQDKLELPKLDLGGQQDPFASGMAFSGGKQVENVVPKESGDSEQPRDPFAAVEAAKDAPAEPTDPFASAEKDDDPFGSTDPAVKTQRAAKTDPAAKPLPDVNPFGENLPTLDLPIEEEPATPLGNIGSGLIDLLGKTLSGAAADRDPFGEAPESQAAEASEAAAPPAEAPPAEAPDDAPSPETEEAEKQDVPKSVPDANPFGN